MIEDKFFDVVSENDKNAAEQEISIDTGDLADITLPAEDAESKHSSHSHGHHHSKHHRSRHHHHSSHRKKGNKVVRFIKKHRNALVNMALLAVIVAMFFVIIFWKEKPDPKTDTSIQSVTDTKGYIQIETSLYQDEISLANPALAEYMASTGKAAKDLYREYEGSHNRLDTGMAVRFSYNVIGIPKGVKVSKAVLEVSENDAYRDSRLITLETGTDTVDIYLLKTGTQYYYRLNLTLSDGSLAGSCGSFKTAQSPRFLTVEGGYNMRDIGGWTTLSGETIKQGLLYRGAEIDGAIESKYCLTAEGIVQMTSDLKIKTDMDLRDKSATPDGKDILGANIKHTYYGAPMYKAVFEEINYERMRRIFSDLADEGNYPIYLHCTYGRDRTGTVCYLLEALLGLSDENLRREYEMSAFNDSYADFESFSGLVTLLSTYEGDTTQEKAENYLLSIGVTADEIANIRRIFLG